jgi:hypothetical protein
MDVQNRFVSLPTRQIALGAALVLGLVVVMLIWFASLERTAQPLPMTAPQVIASPEGSPDAQDRNGTYNQASVSKWRNESPDAQERNATDSHRVAMASQGAIA